jgi:catalase
MKPSYRLTTNQGVPVSDNQNSKTAGQQGPKDSMQLKEFKED